MMTINSRRIILRIPQFIVVSFFLIAPFINTPNGNGLIRFDVERLRLYLFNSIITFDNFFSISVAALLFVFLLILVTQVFGRVWCGWMCPQSFFGILIIDLSAKVKKTYQKICNILAAFFFSLILSLNWMWYFIKPKAFVSDLFNGSVSTSIIIWFIIFIILFLDFAFIKFLWCRYICPYAKMQTLMTDGDTLYIGMLDGKEDSCIKCLSCVKKCPAKIDPRKTPNNACVYCETCITTCEKVLSKKGAHSVLGYNWGNSGRFNIFRANLMITLAVSILLAVILAYNVFENQPLSIRHELISEDMGVYSVELKLKNGTSKNMIVTFNSENGGSINPETLSLKAKESKKILLTIKSYSNKGGIRLKAITNGGFEQNIKIEQE